MYPTHYDDIVAILPHEINTHDVSNNYSHPTFEEFQMILNSHKIIQRRCSLAELILEVNDFSIVCTEMNLKRGRKMVYSLYHIIMFLVKYPLSYTL